LATVQGRPFSSFSLLKQLADNCANCFILCSDSGEKMPKICYFGKNNRTQR
jgi:hypothetical protein